MKTFIALIILISTILMVPEQSAGQTQKIIQDAQAQTTLMLKEVEAAKTEWDSKKGVPVSPRTLSPEGNLILVPSKDWTSGFFPGVMWFLYEFTGDKKWEEQARNFTAQLEKEKVNGGTHDMGFKIYCSYGNGYRLTNDPAYKDIIIQSAKTLSTRFNPKVGCIRSWDHNADKWQFPVIIDNMMNLELLFAATRLTGDSSFFKIAVSHANTTMKNHYRPDYSSYHVIDYDPATGNVLHKHTHQGYAHESAWARGQAWGVYGYTMCYRETKNPKYLEQAEKIAAFILNNPHLPKDLIPYWDFDAPNIPNEPRDASAAAIIASAFYELSYYSAIGKFYIKKADQIMSNLTKHYRSPIGQNRGFILLHSTGSKPMNSEVDVPLNYADYYYLEALLRAKKLSKKPAVTEKKSPFESVIKKKIVDDIRKITFEKASQFLKEEPVTVTASSCKRSAGGKNDFYSEGDYWWPDPANPGGPYIQKDGQTNPDNFVDHRLAMIRLSEITATLTSAWLLTGEQKFATQVLKHLNAWFVNPATKMNPNMLYAQAIWGRFTGRGIGLIDAYHLVEVVRSIKVLEAKNALSAEHLKPVKAWFAEFLKWMTTHQYGIDEMNAKNNHGTCWAVTASAMADLTGNEEVKKLCRDRFKTIFLPTQMADDGSFPLELKRTKPYGYSLFNIDAMCNLAQILSTPEDNLWNFTTPDGKNLKKGMEFIFPFIADKSKWPFAKDIYIWDEWPVRQSSLLFAGIAYGNDDYINTYLKLAANPTHPEVIRNLPVRHPIIWFIQ